jgi:TRAP-type C4-dicarboxylate transport system permease small subunit
MNKIEKLVNKLIPYIFLILLLVLSILLIIGTYNVLLENSYIFYNPITKIMTIGLCFIVISICLLMFYMVIIDIIKDKKKED